MLGRRVDDTGLNLFSVDTIRNLENITVEGSFEGDFAKDSNKYLLAASQALHNNIVTSINAIVNGHLYLGSKEQARRQYVLAAIGITDVMIMAQSPLEPAEAEAFQNSNITFWEANIPDILGLCFTTVLRAVLHLIESKIFSEASRDFALSDIGNKDERFKCANGKVLFVHCIQGVSRSAAVVVGYLMFRLYIGLGLEEEIFDFWELLHAVKKCRHCCPNLTFMTNLFFLWECLKILRSHTVLQPGQDLRQVRRAEFDQALQMGEYYFDFHSRNMSETFGFLNCEVLGVLKHGMETVQKQGLATLSLKKSLLRDSSFWLSRAVFLRSLNVYMLNIAPGSVESGDGDADTKYANLLSRFGFPAPRSGPNSSATMTEELTPRAYADSIEKQSQTVERATGMRIKLVSLKSAERLSCLSKPIARPTLPICLFYEMEAPLREKWIAFSLGLAQHQPETTLALYTPSRMLQSSIQLATEVSELSQALMRTFGCRTWSLWLMAMIDRDCDDLRRNCTQWLSARPPPPVEPTLGIIMPQVAQEGPDLRQAAVQLPEPKKPEEAESPDHSASKEVKKRIRYEDVSIQTLKREIERAKHKLQRINAMLGE
eukprot:Gregarina_sp_Poly_1__2772@NODE_176_length_12008_cov_147_545264_g156_i0_p2_GENE_NODE_176_length_12008_cov_147_545264_g156_i0NODE_176_length_12008_cov_147_545264_g156_i0_p2_ORF_typecomplete_len601_score90_94DSPc/PF00782_20/4_7e11_NODE_176_length_12008_cov_147_545264_g156_i081489950